MSTIDTLGQGGLGVDTEDVVDTDDGAPALSPPEQRGTTHIADRVVEKVAAQAVDEVDLAGGTAPRMLGVPLGRDRLERSARVSATVDGGLVTVVVGMSVEWPSPVRQVAGAVREHVQSRVGELIGLEVREVDIEVSRLVRPGQPPRRVQ